MTLENTRDRAEQELVAHPLQQFHLLKTAGSFGLLVASMLASVQFRLTLTLGLPLGADYVAHSVGVYLLILGSLVVSYGLGVVAQQVQAKPMLAPERQFRVYLLALGFSVITTLILLPDISRLQMLYYGFFGTLLGMGVIVLPNRLRAGSLKKLNILEDLRETWERRYLLRLWTRYRIESRYTETVLGLLWIMLLPIAQATILSFAFTLLLGMEQGDTPFISFLLSGMLVFNIFNYLTMRSVVVLNSMMGVIAQVYFPREVILLLLLGEALIDFFFAFIAFIILSAISGLYPNINYIYIPIPILIMSVLSLGIGFIMSWLGLVVRDLQQILGVLTQFLFYMTVLFRVDAAPPALQILPLFNPLSALVEAFRDIVLYNRPPQISSLFVSSVIAVAVLYTGYVMFKVNEDRFVDYL